MVYDIGFAVVERSTCKVLHSASLVISDVFYGRKRDMQSAHYANKLPQYRDGIKSGLWNVVRLKVARAMVAAAMRQYGVNKVYAYNCSFDRNALDNSAGMFIGEGTEFFPKGTEFADIWHMACTTLFRQKRYHAFAKTHGMVSRVGNVKTSAEAAYAYMTKNPDFSESHTGLDDVHIEVAIMQCVLRQKKKITEAIVPNPWKLAQNVQGGRQMSLC
jgi:hypothetical protein